MKHYSIFTFLLVSIVLTSCGESAEADNDAIDKEAKESARYDGLLAEHWLNTCLDEKFLVFGSKVLE